MTKVLVIKVLEVSSLPIVSCSWTRVQKNQKLESASSVVGRRKGVPDVQRE